VYGWPEADAQGKEKNEQRVPSKLPNGGVWIERRRTACDRRKPRELDFIQV